MEIDRYSGVPAYVQIATWLRGQILSGEIGPDQPIPSKRQLRAQLGVSGQTVDKAVAVLRDEGLVRTAIGFGHYVVPPGEQHPPPG